MWIVRMNQGGTSAYCDLTSTIGAVSIFGERAAIFLVTSSTARFAAASSSPMGGLGVVVVDVSCPPPLLRSLVVAEAKRLACSA